jgi:hypothetical protein
MKYVTSVYSNYTSELDSEIVVADTIEDAFINCSLCKDWIEDMPKLSYIEEESVEILKRYMFDNDHAINIIRID